LSRKGKATHPDSAAVDKIPGETRVHGSFMGKLFPYYNDGKPRFDILTSKAVTSYYIDRTLEIDVVL
jgi:predicted HAD superfamily Cof-like phosphohydrolase